LTRLKGLEDNSKDSQRELCTTFSSHFTAQKRQPKTLASLSNIVQDKEESLRDYIKRFTREAIEVKGTNGGDLWWFLRWCTELIKTIVVKLAFYEFLCIENVLNQI
jgi:hypothetical protein